VGHYPEVNPGTTSNPGGWKCRGAFPDSGKVWQKARRNHVER
jgi:hypothetical protein